MSETEEVTQKAEEPPQPVEEIDAKPVEEIEAKPVEEAKIETAKSVEEKEEDKKAEDKKKKEDSEELTKRLQKLALERQKTSTGDRLKVIQSDSASHLTSAKTFQELNLPKYLLDALFAMGFDRPSAIQEEALPRILADPPRNIIGQAQSGSGKTAAFTLGMLYRTVIDDPPTTQALCVTPSRELAIQIFEKAVKPMAANMMGLKIQLAIAGTQAERGKPLPAHIVIGTPGKVVDWLKRKIIQTNNMKVFVLDEADHMVEEGGHRANSQLIKKMMPKICQSLLFSATFPDEVVKFAEKMVPNPDKILIDRGPESLVRLKGRNICLALELGIHSHLLCLNVGLGCDQAALDRHSAIRRRKAGIPLGYLLAVDHRPEYRLCGNQTKCRHGPQDLDRGRVHMFRPSLRFGTKPA
jgi:ATP-dependent RNA helicase DDX19/DBP5